MADNFDGATSRALAIVAQRTADQAEAENEKIVSAYQPSSVTRTIDGATVLSAAELTLRIYQIVAAARRDGIARKIVFKYSYMTDVIGFALQTLKSLSPVGSSGDKHPGLYRDSHVVFFDGQLVSDFSAWRPGVVISISNPEPYSRKIEVGHMTMRVPGHVYESSVAIVNARYGNSADVKLVYMPITFGSIQAWANYTTMQRSGRKLNPKARGDWLSRQPALQITAR